MPKLVYIVTVPLTARAFLRGQLKFLKERSFDVTVISAPGPELIQVAEQEDISVSAVPMEREIAPLHDLSSLHLLNSLLRTIRPDIVNAGTPKAGLLGMIAAKMTGVPVRIYQLRGLRLETATGLKRTVLTATERIASASAHHVVCNSNSLLERYAELGLAPRRKLTVLGPGSSNGVDFTRFAPTPASLAAACDLRRSLGIPDNTTVFGFVGRFTRDKGISELVDAFVRTNRRFPQTSLLLVGDYEQGDPVPNETSDLIQHNSSIFTTGFVSDTARYYHLIDILVFPSYREGFPNAPLEAAAAGIPTIGFDTTGVRDAIRHGRTGLVVPLGSIDALSSAMIDLATNPAMRQQLGENAKAVAETEFRPQDVWQRWVDFYLGCMAHQV